jgi:hypothetical protein
MEFILQQSFFVDEIYDYKGKRFYDIYAILFSNDCRFGYGIWVYVIRLGYITLRVVAELALGVWDLWHICLINVWPCLQNCVKHEHKVNVLVTL